VGLVPCIHPSHPTISLPAPMTGDAGAQSPLPSLGQSRLVGHGSLSMRPLLPLLPLCTSLSGSFAGVPRHTAIVDADALEHAVQHRSLHLAPAQARWQRGGDLAQVAVARQEGDDTRGTHLQGGFTGEQGSSTQQIDDEKKGRGGRPQLGARCRPALAGFFMRAGVQEVQLNTPLPGLASEAGPYFGAGLIKAHMQR
jgi:hypothetical protein